MRPAQRAKSLRGVRRCAFNTASRAITRPDRALQLAHLSLWRRLSPSMDGEDGRRRSTVKEDRR